VFFPHLIGEVEAVLVSDYAKGALSQPVLEHVFKVTEQARKPVIVDPKGKDFNRYKGATLLTPNRREAAEACNFDSESSDLVSRAGHRLLEELGLRAMLITQSEHGMTLFERGRDPQHYEAAAKEVYDVTGAGDTVIATMAVAVAAGAGFCEAARLANIAAGVVVQQVGTAAISRQKLLSSLIDTAGAEN